MYRTVNRIQGVDWQWAHCLMDRIYNGVERGLIARIACADPL